MSRPKIANSQREKVLNHLINHSGITSVEAFENYGITRLSSIIFNLKNEGYNIHTQLCHSVNRYGNTCTYAKYSLN